MGSLVLTVGTTASPRTRTRVFPDAFVARALAAIKANYGQISDGAGGMRDMTNVEALDRWVDGVEQSLIDITYRSEVTRDTTTAVGNVSKISFS